MDWPTTGSTAPVVATARDKRGISTSAPASARTESTEYAAVVLIRRSMSRKSKRTIAMKPHTGKSAIAMVAISCARHGR